MELELSHCQCHVAFKKWYQSQFRFVKFKSLQSVGKSYYVAIPVNEFAQDLAVVNQRL